MIGFRRKLIINVGIIIALILLFGGALFASASRISEISASILSLKDKAYRAQLEVLEFTGLKEDEEKADSALLIMRKALLQRDDLFTFRAEMENLARKRNLRFGFSFGAESAPSASGPGSVNFSISVEGSFSQIILFINDMETSGRLLRLNQSTITESGSGATGKIEGKIFFTDTFFGA